MSAAGFGPALVALVVLALVAIVWAIVQPELVDRRAVAARRARGRRPVSSGPARRAVSRRP